MYGDRGEGGRGTFRNLEEARISEASQLQFKKLKPREMIGIRFDSIRQALKKLRGV